MLKGKPVFRHPDKIQELPWRKWMREALPCPQEGFVVEDLDLLVLRFGGLEGRPYDADGCFFLAEIKQNGVAMGYAQKRVWSLVHRLLRQADPEKKFYAGFYLVNWDTESVLVNRTQMTLDQFKEFLLGRIQIHSLFD